MYMAAIRHSNERRRSEGQAVNRHEISYTDIVLHSISFDLSCLTFFLYNSLLNCRMHGHSRGENLRENSADVIEGKAASLCIICFIPFIFFFGFSLFVNGWSEYQQAKMHVRKFQSTTCRIEDIIIEEVPTIEKEEVKTTSVNASYLIKVVNSTKEINQFRSATVPLLLKPKQHSLVSPTNLVNSDYFLNILVPLISYLLLTDGFVISKLTTSFFSSLD